MRKAVIHTERPDYEQAPVEVRISEPTADGEVHFLDLLIVLAKRKWTIGCVTVACGLISLVYSLLLPKIYTADTKILPPQQTQSVATAMLGQLGSLGAFAGKDLGLRNPNDLYVAMLESRSLSDAIIHDFDLLNVYKSSRVMDARKRLEEATDIESGKDGVIKISVDDRDPKRAADIANAYVTNLYKLTKTLAISEAAQRRVFFEQQLRSANDDLARAEQELQRAQENTGLIQLDSQSKAMIESLAAARAQIAAKEVQIQAMKAFATDQNPDLIRAQNELAALKAQLAVLEHNQTGPAGERQLPLTKLPSAGLEYIRALREVKYYETVFDLLSKQYEVAKIDEAKNATIIQVLDTAVPPEWKSKPKRAVMVVVGTLLGFFFGIIGAFFSEAVRYAKTQSELSARLELLKRYLLAKPREL